MEEEQGKEAAPVLNLDLEDKKLAFFIEQYEKKYDEFDKTKKLTERRKTNTKYLFGRQLDDVELKTYEKKYIDNVIKEGEDTLRTLVLSRLPDIIVNPGAESQVSTEVADLISEAVNKTLQSDELKQLLTLAFRRHSLDLTGVIKYYWNSSKGKLGDIEWEVIPAKYIKIDTSATKNNERYMKLIIHEVERCLYDWIILFPEKEDELKDFARDKGWKETNDEEGRAFDLKVQEIWFDWKEKAENFDPKEPEFESMSGILWKAGKGEKSILDKRKNPNWDWDGEEKPFFNGKPVSDEMLPQISMMGMQVPGVEMKTVYRNYFGKPRKPFIFMGYEQYGESAFDEISRIEENRLLQDNYDTRGMQITKMIDDARGKHVFSTMSGLKKETIEEMDLNDPDEDIVVDGNLGEVHAFIKKEQPSQAMFGDLERTKQRVKEKLHISGAASGELTSDVATTTQIQREASFTIADDFSDLAINKVATEMAEALLHMFKLRYTSQHFQLLIGRQGGEVQERLTSDVIEDGLEVSIKASGTDKLKRERMAKEEATLGLIDPINYFQDVGRTDAEKRAEMLFMFQTNPEMYIQKYAKGMELQDVANQVMGMNQQNLMSFGNPQGPYQPQPPMQPSPQNPQAVSEVPSGSPRNLIGKATGAISKLFNR